ncbi:MAG TPA: TonB-dependent receptor, partial [Novosphingobium sp.]|nr:TonB-dependent receptor [Novosphingobium sp.]
PALVIRALQSCVGVSNCTGSGYTAPIRQSISNAAYVGKDYNASQYQGVRVALGWHIDPDWSIDVMHMRQKLTSDGVFDYEPGVGDLAVQKYNPNTLDDTFDMTTVEVAGRIGALSVLYAGSYVHHHAVQNADYASYSNVGLYLPYYECDKGVYYNHTANAGNTCYTPSKHYTVNDTNRRWTNELRVVTPGDWRLRGTVGVFYDVNKIYDNTDWYYSQPAAGYIYPRSANPVVNPNDASVKPVNDAFFNDTYRRDSQFAVYGEASFDIIPKKLILTGGMRYYSESASLTGSSDGSFGGARGVYDPATGTYSASANPPQYYNYTNLATSLAGLSPAHYHGVIPKGNLTYKFDSGALVYATYSEGFRPGGFNRKPCNTNTAACTALKYYVPDQVKNYEIGWKVPLFHHHLQLNAAAYIVRWTNIQMSVFDQNISNQTFTANLLDARIHGIEGDVYWRPLPGFTLTSSFSYNDSKVTGYRQNVSTLVPVGSPLAMSPKFQLTSTARKEFDMGRNYTSYIQLTWHHVSSSISSDVSNTDIRWTGGTVTYNGVTVHNGDSIVPIPVSLPQAGYDTLSAAVGVHKDGWALDLFGENLTNARPELFKSTSDGETRVTTSRPLTVGLRASFTY